MDKRRNQYRYRWRLLTAAPVLLALVLMGCPTAEEGEESDGDGAVPESTKPLQEFSESPHASLVTPGTSEFVLKAIPEGSTYGVLVTAGEWSYTEIEYETWYAVMHEWALPYANYKLANHGMNGAGDANSQVGFDGDPFSQNDYSSNWKTRPTAGISLRDAIVFCNAISEALGKSPVYRCEHDNILKDATTEVEKLVDVSKMTGKDGFRLPTVDEYIYASNKERGTYGQASRDGQDWGGGTHKQTGGSNDAENGMTSNGSRNAINSLGLAWMFGNTWKWCYNFDNTYGLMGGDIWDWDSGFMETYQWTIREGSDTDAANPGSKNAASGPTFSLRVRTN